MCLVACDTNPQMGPYTSLLSCTHVCACMRPSHALHLQIVAITQTCIHTSLLFVNPFATLLAVVDSLLKLH